VALWYPTDAVPAELRRGPYTLSVARDAAVAPGPHALVVISHGTGGTNLGHHDTAAHLARNGAVVAAPQHPRDNVLEVLAPNGYDVLAGRPRLLSAVIDTLLASETLGQHIDPARIGAIGFSKGGYTVLTALGAEPSMTQPHAHCAVFPSDAFCNHPSTQGHPPLEHRALDNLADPRIRAAVLLAPATGWHTDAALTAITAPIRLYYAEHDEQLSEPFHAERLARVLRSPPEIQCIADAGHYAFLAPFPEAAKATLGVIANDRPGFDRHGFHDRLNAEIATFFASKL
jgi:predicted dienelactone hydrolase